MPTTSVRDDYARWMASPPTTGLPVETLEFTGAALPEPLLICNRKDAPLVAQDEDGLPRTFLPISFTISKPAIRNSSEYAATARLDGLNGNLLELFGNIRSNELVDPLYAVFRIFIDPTMLDRPCWMAPLRFRVETGKVGMDAIELTLVGGRLPTKRAGLYYVLQRFAGLRPY